MADAACRNRREIQRKCAQSGSPQPVKPSPLNDQHGGCTRGEPRRDAQVKLPASPALAVARRLVERPRRHAVQRGIRRGPADETRRQPEIEPPLKGPECADMQSGMMKPSVRAPRAGVRQRQPAQESIGLACPGHPCGGCSPARHDTYGRNTLPARVTRRYCTESHNTFSLLPDCLAARTPGTLDGVEAAINSRQRNVFLRHLSNLLKSVRLRQSGPRMLDASLCGPRQGCSAPALRWRSPAWGASEIRRDGTVPACAWRPATIPADVLTSVRGVSFLDVLFRQSVKEGGGGRGVAGRLGQDLDHT